MAELGTAYVDVKGDFDSMEKGIGPKMGAIAGIAAGAFAAAFAAKKLFNFGEAAVGEANDLAESANAVAQTFTGTALPAVQALGDKAAESFGLSTAQFNQMAVQFAGFAEQINASDVGGVIEDVGTRVADFASVMNLDVNEAASEFQSIMAGSSEVARKYGLDVSAAAVEQFALENGLASSASEMTEAIKVQARYGILMQQTEKWAGDFADTSDQLANSTRIAQAEFKNAQAEIGQALLPVLAEVVGVARDALIPLIQKLSPVFIQVAASIGQLLPPVVDLITRLTPLIEKILPFLVNILGKVMEVVLALLTPIIDLVLVALDPLIDIVIVLADDLLEALMPAILAVAEALVALTPLVLLVTDLLKPLMEIAGFLAKVSGTILAAAIEVLALALQWLIDKIRPLITWITNLATKMSTELGKLLPNIIDWFQDLPQKIWDALKGAGQWLLDVGEDIIGGLIQGIKNMAGSVISTIKGWITDKIPGFIKDALGISSPSKVMIALGREVTRGMAKGIGMESGQVDRALNSLLGAVPNLGTTFGTDLALAGVGGGGVVVHNHGPVVGDMHELAQEILAEAAREQRYAS